MGHFSHSCHLSGLPITGGTKVVLLPLLPKDHFGFEARHDKLTRYGQSCLVSNDGPNLYFEEMCFPIFGEYDDYGGLEKIEKDDNTAVLEEYFNMKIKDIVACLIDGRKDQFKVDTEDESDEFGLSATKKLARFKKNPQQLLLVRASTTWYRRDVFDQLVATSSQKNDPYSKIDLGVHGLLVKLGFTKGKEFKETSRVRYYIPYTKGSVTVYSDGNWISDKKGDSNLFGVYTLKHLKNWMENKGESLEIDDLTKMSYQEQVYECILPTLDKLKSGDQWETERILTMLLGRDNMLHMRFLMGEDDKRTPVEYYQDQIDRLRLELAEGKLNREENKKAIGFDPIEFYEGLLAEEKKKGVQSEIPLFYFKKIKELGNGFLKKNITDWHLFKPYYYATGRFLYPIGTSYQDGDHKAVLELLETATACLKAEMKERKRWDNEDEEEDED